MKKLFIYYSFTGNGDKVAEKLSKTCDLRKIKVKKELPKSFFLQMMVGGFRSLTNYKDKLIDFDNNINNYKEIIIGSPIWNDRLCTPVTTALKELDLNNKKITFILYSGGGQANTAVEFINNNYNNANIIQLQQPLKNESELDKLNI